MTTQQSEEMKEPDIFSEAEVEACLHKTANILRKLLQETDSPKYQTLFSSLVESIYEKSEDLERLHPLEWILPRNVNMENLQSACTILRDTGWVREDAVWENGRIFSEPFFQLMDIPIFMPSAYCSPISAIFLLYLLFPNKEQGLYFYSGLGNKKTARDIAMNSSDEKIKDLKRAYIWNGRSGRSADKSYLQRLEKRFHISFQNLPPINLNKRNNPWSDNDLLTLLEIYDYHSHFYLEHLRNPPSMKRALQEEAKSIAFKTMVLISFYQKHPHATMKWIPPTMMGLRHIRAQFICTYNSCYEIATFSQILSLLYHDRNKSCRYISQQMLKNIAHVLKRFPEKCRLSDVKHDPVKVPNDRIFSAVLWSLEIDDFSLQIKSKLRLWQQFDKKKSIEEKDLDILRHTFSDFFEKYRKSPDMYEINVDNWNDFYKKYKQEVDSLCTGFNEKEKKKKWEHAITSAAYSYPKWQSTKIAEGIRNTTNPEEVKFQLSEIRTKAELSKWKKQHSEFIKSLSLARVLDFMSIYINSDHISVTQKGHDTKFFSEIKSDEQIQNDSNDKKPHPKMLNHFIDKMYRNPYEELDELTSALFQQMKINQQKLFFPQFFQKVWTSFIKRIGKSSLICVDALRYWDKETDIRDDMAALYELVYTIYLLRYGYCTLALHECLKDLVADCARERPLQTSD